MEQELFFRAIEEQNIEEVRKMIANGAEVNALSRRGTALYHSVKLHNLTITKLLVEKGADCNIVQLDIDPSIQNPTSDSHDSYSFFAPIDLLCIKCGVKNDEILQYLLENRSMVNENMINQRIHHCTRLVDDNNQEALFDYFASCFLRRNMYDHLWPHDPKTILTMVAATLNFDASLKRRPVDDDDDDGGGTHEAFFTLTIRSLFEELVRFKLGKAFNIESEQQYAHILRELLHNLEAYNLLMDIYCIPDERKELFYPSIVKNIIKKLNDMKNKEEYTLPMRWAKHAVCLNFVREPKSIVIRIDNLNIGEANKHKTYPHEDNLSVMIPAIIGEIPLDKLDHNKDYFISLLTCMKTLYLEREDGIKILYDNEYLKDLDTSRVREMTDQLEKRSKDFMSFIEQAKNNCFIKSHEPGFAIRSNDPKIFHKIITILRVYTTKMTESKDISQKRNELQKALVHYWENEATMRFNAEYAAQLHGHVVIWLDTHIGEPGNNEQMKQRFRRITHPLRTFTDAQQAIDFITKEAIQMSVFLIVSGTLAHNIVPAVFSCQSVVQIYIFCGNMFAHTDWAEDYIEKILMFDFDEELLIRLTRDIANYLMDAAKKDAAVARAQVKRAAGLLDWADWLYQDAITCQQAFTKKLRTDIKQERKKLDINP